MKKVLLTLVTTALTTGIAIAADQPAQPDAKKMEIMKAYEKAATPGAAHKIFEGMDGSWTYTSKWWEAANTKPQESAGTSTTEVILGGRFFQQKAKGTAMGMPFEGMGLTGYDNIKKKYETVWVDNMGTGIMRGEGDYDAKAKTLKDRGEYSCPISAGKKRTYRSEWKLVSKNNFSYSMYGQGEDGKEFKQMEMQFTRTQ